MLGTAKLIFQTPRVATIKSGTDGWRTAIAEDFKFANDALVAQAAADLKV